MSVLQSAVFCPHGAIRVCKALKKIKKRLDAWKKLEFVVVVARSLTAIMEDHIDADDILSQ